MSLLEMVDELHAGNTQGGDPLAAERSPALEQFIRYKLDNWNTFSKFERYDTALKVLLEAVLAESEKVDIDHRETFSVEKAALSNMTQEQVIAVLSGSPPQPLDGYAWLASGCPAVMNLIVFDGDLNVTHEEWQKITSAGCRLWIKGTTSVGMNPGQALVL